MMRLCVVAAGMLLLAAPLAAETYSWVDESGTYNFTEDYSRVPKKYRGKVDKRGDQWAETVKQGSVNEIKAGGAATPTEAGKPASVKPPQRSGGQVADFGGKTLSQWKQDLNEREAAMAAVLKKIEEFDVLLKRPKESTEAYLSVERERSNAVQQYNDMRKQYERQVELARNVGINVKLK